MAQVNKAISDMLSPHGITNPLVVKSFKELSEQKGIDGPFDIHGTPSFVCVVRTHERLNADDLKECSKLFSRLASSGENGQCKVIVIVVGPLPHRTDIKKRRNIGAHLIEWTFDQLTSFYDIAQKRYGIKQPHERERPDVQLPVVRIDSPEVKWMLITDENTVVTSTMLSVASGSVPYARIVKNGSITSVKKKE